MEGQQGASSEGRPQRAVDVFLRYLATEGCRVVFGIPGGLLHPFFAAVQEHDDLQLVVSKHEQGAAFMADGYARVSRDLSVCAGTAGPGATNLLTGVACAFADGVPMLVVTGQAPSKALGKGAMQETGREDIDIVAMFRPVTKYSAMVTSVGNLAQHLRRALRQAMTGRPGPVHLNVPVDLWEQPLEEDWFDPATYRPENRTFDRNAVRAAAEALISAEHPVILVGSGVGIAGAEEQLISIAEMLPARVATSPRGKGLFPEDHALSLGVLGFAGHKPARETILGEQVDLLMTVGASLNESTTFNWSPQLRPKGRLVQLDIDADRIGRNYPVDIALVGDAYAILLEIVYSLHRQIRDGAEPRSAWWDEPPLDHGPGWHYDEEMRESTAVPLTPQRWRRDLQEVLPEDALVFSDMGGHTLFNVHHLAIRSKQRFVFNMGFASMGHGTVAPIGAKLFQPDRPVFTIIGDACFTMNGMDLLTAFEYEIPVIWIVENNQMHGITWHGSQMVGSRKPLDCVVYKQPLDISAIARAMGLESWVVDGPGRMQAAVREALERNRPGVIEVRVDPRVCPPIWDRAVTVAGFEEDE